MQEKNRNHWQLLIQQIGREYKTLPDTEKNWIRDQLVQVEDLQQAMNQLFEQGRGLQSCAECQGDCCARGHNHMTLPNLLGYLQRDELPPVADFRKTCPFLGKTGCLLPVTQRPYNCISFVCDIIEKSLTSEEVDQFYGLEKKLRVLYLEFAARYTGGSLTGLLLQYERLAGRSFLERK